MKIRRARLVCSVGQGANPSQYRTDAWRPGTSPDQPERATASPAGVRARRVAEPSTRLRGEFLARRLAAGGQGSWRTPRTNMTWNVSPSGG